MGREWFASGVFASWNLRNGLWGFYALCNWFLLRKSMKLFIHDESNIILAYCIWGGSGSLVRLWEIIKMNQQQAPASCRICCISEYPQNSIYCNICCCTLAAQQSVWKNNDVLDEWGKLRLRGETSFPPWLLLYGQYRFTCTYYPGQ